ncbi:MAG: hypothetical protein K6E43_08990 [Lachnospiraceae bacterium]|nr:hypothetical protein [Lachnospiraceae bacterium]
MKKAIIIILEFINVIDLIILTDGFKKVWWTIPISGVMSVVLIAYAVLFHIFRLVYLYNIVDHKYLWIVLQTIVLSAVFILFFTVKLTFEYNMLYDMTMYVLYIITIAIDGIAIKKHIDFNKRTASES